jgi:thymidylate synthase (FAD)
VERIVQGAAANKNKQASGVTPLDESKINHWLDLLEHSYRISQEVYERGLSFGIPKELARLPVPVARYSRMRASANLRNWLGFLTLRDHPAAQWEIQQYAREVGKIIEVKFPRTYQLFDQGRK